MTLAAAGEWMGCPEMDCSKGKLFIETKESCREIPCPTCSGRGYIVLWQMTDKTRLKGAA